MRELTLADVITWAGILVLGLLLFAAVLSLEGCQYRHAPTLGCVSETTVNTVRTCESEGSGSEINVILQKTKEIDE